MGCVTGPSTSEIELRDLRHGPAPIGYEAPPTTVVLRAGQIVFRSALIGSSSGFRLSGKLTQNPDDLVAEVVATPPDNGGVAILTFFEFEGVTEPIPRGTYRLRINIRASGRLLPAMDTTITIP